MTPAALSAQVKEAGRGLGFDLVAVGPAGPPDHSAAFEGWLDAATGRYRGRIASKISAPDLQSAIEALLEGRPVRPAQTKAFGCAIARR